jgi:PAS domain S-box-containing protein
VRAFCPERGKFAVVFHEITERKRAEDDLRRARDELERRVIERTAELRESEAKYRLLIENQTDLVVGSDADGHRTFASPSYCRMFGKTEAELSGHEYWSLVHPDDRENSAREVARIFQPPHVARFEERALTVDGWRWLSWSVRAVFDERGQVVGHVGTGRDITERKQAEELLRQANAYNRSLIEASLDPLVTITPGGKIGDVNAATEAVTGLTRAELIGTDFHSYFTNPDKARAGYRKVFEAGAVHDYELEIRHKDGHATPVLYNAVLYHDESGRSMGVFAAARDITQSKLAEKQIQLQSTALEAAANGIFITNPQGTILWCNPAFSLMTGFSQTETIGRTPRILNSGQHDSSFYRNLWQTICGGEVWQGEMINRRKDGSLYTEEQTITPVLDPSGSISYFIAIKQDISERKRAQQELEADRLRLLALSQAERDQRLFAESLAEAMLALNSSLELKTVLDHILEQIEMTIPFNAAGITLLEGTTLHIARIRLSKDVPAEIMPAQLTISLDTSPLWKLALDSQQPVLVSDSQTQPGLNLSSKMDWARSFIIAQLRVGVTVVGFLVLIGDKPDYFGVNSVSRLNAFGSQAALAIQNARLYRDLERALEQEQAVRGQLVQSEKFAAMGRMLASVAHELNNPLQTIKNCLYLIQQDTSAASPNQEYIAMATSETRRLSGLVGQLRELYRPSPTGAVQPNSLNKLITDVHTLLAPHLQSENIVWHQNLGVTDHYVNCVSDQIKQVFINISMNAIEAMRPQGGMLSVKVIPADDGSKVGVAIQDNGPGIPPEAISRLFEPFYTTKSSGLGLGLSICFELIQRHNGQITVDSTLNQGTTFTIWLPLIRNPDNKVP